MSKNARWTKYRREHCSVVQDLGKLGATKRLIANVIGVHEDTIRNWELRYPEFATALSEAQSRADLEVAKSLYKQAVGYSYTSHESHVVRDRFGNQKLVTVELVKFEPPKTAAATFWLKTRQPQIWDSKGKRDERTEIDEILREVINSSRGLPSEHPTAKRQRG